MTGKTKTCQHGMVKKEEVNGAGNRRRVLPGMREMMEESKKTGKKETEPLA